LRSLDRTDIDLLIDGVPAQIATFERGPQAETRPLALWFVLRCNEKGAADNSKFIREAAKYFRPALAHLESRDTVGVAHWCGDGSNAIDLRPTFDHNAAVKVIETITHGKAVEAERDGRKQAASLKEMVNLVLADAGESKTRPLAALVFLYDDEAADAMHETDQHSLSDKHSSESYSPWFDEDTLDSLSDALLKSSSVVYGIGPLHGSKNDAMQTNERTAAFLRPSLSYLTFVTAGRYFAAPSEMSGAAVEDILLRLHSRYELGFSFKISGRHSASFELRRDTRRMYPRGQLYYCQRFIAFASEEGAGK